MYQCRPNSSGSILLPMALLRPNQECSKIQAAAAQQLEQGCCAIYHAAVYKHSGCHVCGAQRGTDGNAMTAIKSIPECCWQLQLLLPACEAATMPAACAVSRQALQMERRGWKIRKQLHSHVYRHTPSCASTGEGAPDQHNPAQQGQEQTC
jgi:hypothetical protein